MVSLSESTVWSDPNAAVAAAVAAAASMAQGRTQGELGRWAAFFTVLGDLLALYALTAPEDSGSTDP